MNERYLWEGASSAKKAYYNAEGKNLGRRISGHSAGRFLLSLWRLSGRSSTTTGYLILLKQMVGIPMYTHSSQNRRNVKLHAKVEASETGNTRVTQA